MAKIRYNFSSKLWKYDGKGAWFFISISKETSKEIRDHLQWQEEGWGRMKASAIIKEQDWKTSIWYDKKSNTYLLPIKASIRKNLSLKEGMIISGSLLI